MNDAITIREATVAEARGIARLLVDGWQTTHAGILPATFLASLNYDQHEVGANIIVPETSPVVIGGGVRRFGKRKGRWSEWPDVSKSGGGTEGFLRGT